jgi:hypothetical protein
VCSRKRSDGLCAWAEKGSGRKELAQKKVRTSRDFARLWQQCNFPRATRDMKSTLQKRKQESAAA